MQALQKLLTTRAVRRAAILIGTLAVLAALVASLDLPPNLARVNLAILSGSESGNYYAIVARLAAEAQRNGGHVENVATQGSVENIKRLTDARSSCRVQFAIVQEGRDWPPGLELVARLPRPETVFFLGRDADRIRSLADFRGLRIGIGPEDSGTALTARVFLGSRDVAGLGLVPTHHPLDEQLSLLQRGALDLGMFVMDEDAVMIEDAIRNRGLAIVSFPQGEVMARRFPRARIGRIEAGQYDAIRMLPPTDKTVFQIDPLVVGNGCTRRSRTTGLLVLLAREFPDLVRHNRATRERTTLPLAAASHQFFESGGPDLGTEYVPWLIDIMPFSNWIYAITAVSILMNVMGLWCRFGLSRIDAQRVTAEGRLAALFRPGITAAEIARLTPTPEHRAASHRAEVTDLVATLEALRARCRKESLSWSSDWGEEMKYRYQEQLMTELLDGLQSFQARVDEPDGHPALESDRVGRAALAKGYPDGRGRRR